MANDWSRGSRDGSARSPLQGGEHRRQDREHGGRRDRHLRVGVSHPSDDPARHRVFEVRASFDGAARGWIARIGEQNPNEQLQGWDRWLTDDARPQAFPTPAACLGDAVARVVAMVDREDTDWSSAAGAE